MKSRQGNSNFIYFIVIAAVLFLVYSYLAGGNSGPTVPLNKIADDIENGKIASVNVRGDILHVTYQPQTTLADQIVISRKGRESSLVEQLQALGVSEEMLRQVNIDFDEPTDWGTLFNLGIGRADFPGSDYNQELNSIRTKLLTLPDDYKIYPGHGPDSKIGTERVANPFLTGNYF